MTLVFVCVSTPTPTLPHPSPQSYCTDPDIVLELKNLIVIFADTLQVGDTLNNSINGYFKHLKMYEIIDHAYLFHCELMVINK